MCNATRPRRMRIDVGEEKTLYTRYLSMALRMRAFCKRDKQVHTIPDEANGSAILHYNGEGQQLRCSK